MRLLEDVNPYRIRATGQGIYCTGRGSVVAHVLGQKPGTRKVADVCAHWGVKLHISLGSWRTEACLACDVNARRVRNGRDVVDRLKLESVKVEQCDARKFPKGTTAISMPY